MLFNEPNMLYATMLEDVDPTCCVRLNRPLLSIYIVFILKKLINNS